MIWNYIYVYLSVECWPQLSAFLDTGSAAVLTLKLVTTQNRLIETLQPVLGVSGFEVQLCASLDEVDQADLIILAPTSFAEKDFQQFSQHPMADEAEWVLISDGKPNRWLDKLMTNGVSYHFRAPLDNRHITEVLHEYYRELTEEQEQRSRQPISSNLDQFGLLLGSSPAMRRLYRLIRRVSQTDANVMLVGESGSGKELAARTVHEQSPRAAAPFIAINCAALTPELVESELFGHVRGAFTGAESDREGCFEQGNGGTLFLDEVTEMPLELQSKLLRVLESGEFRRVGSEKVQKTDVRIVAATNRQPVTAIDDGFLREDIYFRLAHFPIQLPPLRKRGNDIIELAQHFLAYRNQATGTHKQLTDDAREGLIAWHWPGNVRELKHCIEKAHILAVNDISMNELSSIQPGRENDVPDVTDIAPGVSLKDAEKALILATLEACDGNKTHAAEKLGISVKTLYNKLEQYQS